MWSRFVKWFRYWFWLESEAPPVVGGRIVQAVMAASVPADPSLPGAKNRSKRVEQAMSAAVTQAMAEGISLDNSVEIKRRMMAAREIVLAG